jgi:putative phosphoesterase
MRWVILSDTHGFVDPFVQELAQSADGVIHSGDIGGVDVLSSIKPKRGRLVAVVGNNDFPQSWSFPPQLGFSELQESALIRLPGGDIAVEHGHRIWDTRHYHLRLRAKHPKARAIVYGHTHIRCADLSRDPWVMNPGAAGRERTKGGASCIVLEIGETAWRVHEYQNGMRSASHQEIA